MILMKRTSCILFDVGGVLINWKNRWLIDEISKKYGLDKHQLYEEFSKCLPLLYSGKINEKQFWNKISNKIKSPNLSNITNSLFDEVFRKYASINVPLVNLAQQIKESGIKIGLLANTEPAKFKVVKEMIPIQNFDFVFLSYQIGFVKPDMKIYQYVLKRLPFQSHEIIFIDDRKSNVEAAKHCGIEAIEFFGLDGLIEELTTRKILKKS